MQISLELNDTPSTLDVRTDEMLLDVLRRADLRSVRATCGIGACGACTVLVDGEPISACLTLAPLVDGRRVQTLEGLGGDAVQTAFDEVVAFQCGYCTPGMILTARALLDREPDPNRETILDAMNGNLCRCGCYPKIVRAVELAAERRRAG